MTLLSVSAWIVLLLAQVGPSILLPGDEYTAAEVPPHFAGRWLGLYEQGTKGWVREANVSIQALHDPCLDESPSERSGRAVVVAGPELPLLLMRDIPGVAVGAAPSVRDLQQVGLRRAMGTFHDSPVLVRSVPEGNGFRLELVYREKTSQLYGTDWQDEGFWKVHWIGDLNGDDLPDVLFSATHKYSVHTVRLSMSQTGGSDRIEVATFTHTAC
jgi:hypothetical protein